MSPEHWHRIESIFQEAVDLPIADRPAFLDAVCGSDLEIREQVESLLRADDHPAPLFDTPPNMLLESSPAAAPRNVGPYRLLEELGRGGMGAVYHAERADGQFAKKVALKLVKRGMDTDEILRRFRHERQILATLEHPNIARLYDGGATEDGRSYIVMEYVDGVPIDRYCDDRTLDVNERLSLFSQACTAVHHAHQNLVVHRDLKPSNILVTSDGVVKLLDFGIAKLTDIQEGESIFRTRTDVRLLTPEYASPEQLAGNPVTTATDVYGLGVVLYELLCGRRPHEASRSRPDAGSEHATLPPSAAISTPPGPQQGNDASAPPGEISARRRMSTDALRRRLRGDLDTIVLKSLQPDPSRRYASAEALLADVQRHLAGEAIEARRDSLVYRSRTFVRRHRVGVSIAAGFLVILVSATVAISILQVQAARERDTATAVALFLEELFGASDPFARTDQRLDTLRALDLVNLGSRRLGTLQSEPQVQARLADILGNVYRGIGAYDSAVVMHQKALEIRRTTAGSAWRETVASMRNLASNHLRRGDFEAAIPVLEEALALVPEREIGTRARLLQPLANAQRSRGDFDLAQRYLEESIAIQRAIEPPEEPSLELASMLNDMSLLLRERERYEEAEPWIREALGIWEAVGRDHPEMAAMLSGYGAILRQLGRLDEAETVMRRAMDIEMRILGEDHPSISMTLTHLAELARSREDYPAAVELYRNALNRIIAADPENAGVAIVSGLLANVLRENGDHGEAEAMYIRSITDMKRIFPETHVRIGRAYMGLGHNYRSMGDLAKAEAAYQEAEKVFSTDGNPGIEHAYRALASLYNEWQRPTEAALYQAKLE